MHSPRLLIALALLVVVALSALSCGGVAAFGGYTIEVRTSKGIECDRDRTAQFFNLTTGICYHDRISGLFHSFECRAAKDDICFFGSGSLDPYCHAESSRNAMQCGSCTLTDAYTCAPNGESIIWHTGCAPGMGCVAPEQNCSRRHLLPVQKCIKNPVGSYWLKMGSLEPCGTLLVQMRTYVPPPGAMGAGCKRVDGGHVVEEAVPSGYCSAGTPDGFSGVSRRMSCVLQREEQEQRHPASREGAAQQQQQQRPVSIEESKPINIEWLRLR
jgi:hypothetical protein